MSVMNEPWSKLKCNPDIVKDVSPRLVMMLSDLDQFCGNTLVVHCLFDPERDLLNFHRQGLACDFHLEHWHPLEQFLAAGRYPWGGIGVYGIDVWKHPGLHVDLGPDYPARRWGAQADKKGKRDYVPLNKQFIDRLLKLMP